MIMVLTLMTLAQPLRAEEAARALTVTGVGHAEAKPDMAVVTLGVSEQAKTAKAAVEAMSRGTRAVISRLSGAGIEDRDMQTSGLSLYPVYNRGSLPGSENVLAGFNASTTLTVRIRALDSLGEVLDQVVGAGANQINGISFDVSDPQSAQDSARAAAIADALRKARLMAEAAEVTLGDILQIGESPSGGIPIPMARAEMVSMAAVPVVAGESTFESTIQLKIEVR